MRAKQVIWTIGWWVVAVGCVAPACSAPDRNYGSQHAGTGGSVAGGPTAGSSGAGSPTAGGAEGGEPSLGGSSAGQSGGEECGAVVCASEATCEMAPEAHCVCPEGYADPQADGTSCQDLDECSNENGGCDPLVACVNTPGSFSCGTCPEGFSGEQGECVDTDECAVDNGGCDPLAACTNTGGGFACGSCPFGYTGEGSGKCVDIDECKTNNGGCDKSVACKNTPGGFTCGDCPAGHTGGGATGCIDIDECKTNNGGCDALTKCTNTAGSFTCGACPSGYAGTGATGCVNVNECATNNGGCDANAKCTDTAGSRTCACKAGYSGSGVTCADVDECATSNGGCDADAKCTNTTGSRTCACKSGYSGDGLTCSCSLSAPRCVSSLTQESCVGDVLTQKACTGNQATCIEGTGCLSCSGVRCGSTCCPAAPSNGTAICTGTNTCGVDCKTNYHGCNGNNSACYPNSGDPGHCGNSCVACVQPNATPSCTNGSCSYACPAGLALGCLRADGSPVCSTWDFETSLPGLPTEGLVLDLTTTTGSDGVFAQSTKHATSGTHSLAIGFTGNGSNEFVDVKLPMCPGGQGLDLTKRKLTMSVYPETKATTTPYPSNQNGNYVIAYGKSGGQYGGCDGQTPPPDALFNWECDAAIWSTDIYEIVLRFRVHQAWQGTFYIDNIKLQ